MQTIPSPLTPSEDEHNIAALLTPVSRDYVARLQAQLVQLLADAIWLTPADCLHITLMEIIRDAEYQGLTRAAHYQQWDEQYRQLTKKIIAEFGPCDLHFDQLIVSERAIIVKAADPAPLNRIREALLARIKLPEGTKLPPDIAHCTLARFHQAINLEEAQKQARQLACDFVEHITEFGLVKDIAPPDFDRKIIDTFSLLGPLQSRLQ